MAAMGPVLRPNVATVLGMADARSSNPARPAAVLEAIQRINVSPTQATDGFGAPADPLYGLLGVHFVFGAPHQRLPAPLRLILKRDSVWVYERPGALPRLFLPAGSRGCESALWSACTAGVGDFGDLAVVRGEVSPWRAGVPAASSLRLIEVEPARVRAELQGGERRLLASSIFQDGGWRVVFAGGVLRTTVANGPFVAAWMPPGNGEVDVVYRPPGFFFGMGLAALALAGSFAVFVVPPARRRAASRSQT